MSLWIHLLIHLILSFLAGLIAWKIWKNSIPAFLFALVGGFFVDADHLIDYFLAFGWNFNPYYFIKGFEFLKSNKIYTFFHGWEYAAIFFLLVLISKNIKAKTVFLALALGLFFHLVSDVAIDKIPVRSYSIIYKFNNNFEIQKLVNPAHFEKHEQYRKEIGF